MTIFDAFSLLGGLAMFMFGMSLMGDALEKCAGSKLKTILSKITASPLRGLILGLSVTAVIQSSSATTVMVVGFVNSGLMELVQSVYIIMGANIGTSITAWILSLAGIEGNAWYITMLKPSSFTPILAFIGIAIYMFTKKQRQKDVSIILLGFAVLMFGMETMSDAVKPLADMPGFADMFTMFSNPILGVLVGTVLTAVIQSSSASVGILQALSLTGAVTYGSAIPIIMGQNIGTCVTAVLASAGANRNAKRTSVIHLAFNIIGTVTWLVVFSVSDMIFQFSFTEANVSPLSIAILHTAFNVLNTALLLPFGKQLVALAHKVVPDKREKQKDQLLDELLFVTPTVAIEQARKVSVKMAQIARDAFFRAIELLDHFDQKGFDEVGKAENLADEYEDQIGTYLVHLSAQNISEADSREISELLHMIGDFERISDHAMNVAESALELHDKGISFSENAKRELQVMISAVCEALDRAVNAFAYGSPDDARHIEPLENVVDTLRDAIRARHITRLTRGECTIEMGFVLTDLLTNLERVSDHCSNVGACVIETSREAMDMHHYTEALRDNRDYTQEYHSYEKKYTLPQA